MEAIEEIWKRPSPAFRECRTVGGDSSTPWHQLLTINRQPSIAMLDHYPSP